MKILSNPSTLMFKTKVQMENFQYLIVDPKITHKIK